MTELIGEASVTGADLFCACVVIGLQRTLKLWWKALLGDGVGVDRLKDTPRLVDYWLSDEERQLIF
jgi:hypothetical protein